MSLMFCLQVFAIAVGAASLLFDHVALGGLAPASHLWLNDLIYGGFLVWWAASIAWIRRRGVADDSPDGWYSHTLAVFWLGNAATIASFWLLLPYGDQQVRVVATMLCLGPVTVEMIGTVRSPPARRGLLGTLVPIGIPIGLVAWFIGSADQFALTISAFVLAFSAMLLLLREFVQNVVDAAYAAKVEAEAARDSRSRFLAAASHDLGQPLQAARLFFDQATRAGGEPERRAAVRNVNWAFGAMEQQIRQMLDHLKLEAGAVKVQLTDVSLGEVLARLTEMYEPAARLGGASIVAVPTALFVRADPALLERALSNYLANAVRHAAANRVLIGARRSGGAVRIWVIDNGRGIAPADATNLFSEFRQGAWSRGDEVRGGFGLGLASARRMADLMGGGAGYDPRWRRGSAFWIELPAGDSLGS